MLACSLDRRISALAASCCTVVLYTPPGCVWSLMLYVCLAGVFGTQTGEACRLECQSAMFCFRSDGSDVHMRLWRPSLDYPEIFSGFRILLPPPPLILKRFSTDMFFHFCNHVSSAAFLVNIKGGGESNHQHILKHISG